MDRDQDKFLLDIQAEKQSFSSMLDTEDDMADYTESNKNISKPIFEEVQTQQMSMPIMEDESLNLNFLNDQNKTLKDDSLRIESSMTGVNYDSDISSIENLQEQILKNKSDIGEIATGVSNAYNELHALSTREKEGDPFEERPTVLPTNLIFYDRIKRTVETNNLN